jgi:LemA protein
MQIQYRGDGRASASGRHERRRNTTNQNSWSGEDMIGFLGFLALVIAVVFWLISLYNNLVDLRNRFKNAFSQIDVQLKRRYDLIPNLVETAKAYMAHERETLEAVIAARNSAVQASQRAAADPADGGALRDLAAAESTLAGGLGKLFALSESYPDLKANQNMMQLSEELTSTENKVSFARQAFNDAVTGYNTAIQKFPDSIIAGSFGFLHAELLKATESEAERSAVQVKF